MNTTSALLAYYNAKYADYTKAIDSDPNFESAEAFEVTYNINVLYGNISKMRPRIWKEYLSTAKRKRYNNGGDSISSVSNRLRVHIICNPRVLDTSISNFVVLRKEDVKHTEKVVERHTTKYFYLKNTVYKWVSVHMSFVCK